MSFCDTSTRALESEAVDARYRRLVEEAFRRVELALNPEQVEAFVAYARMLERWGGKINLTAIHRPEDVVVKHFLDSALALTHVNLSSGESVADIGSGAGFPGVPMAILRPDAQFVLFEATEKKAAFLHALVAALRLESASVETERLDPRRVPNEWRSAFHGVVSRYTASLSWLASCARVLVKPSGWLVAFKNDAPGEREILERLPRTHGASRVAWRRDERAEPCRHYACVWF